MQLPTPQFSLCICRQRLSSAGILPCFRSPSAVHQGVHAVQKVELKADKVLWVGKCDNSRDKYPLSKKGQSMESLRERLHLRPRTNLIGAVARIRNALAHATHTFFQSRGFVNVHTPIITTSDCEGAGEMFQASYWQPHFALIWFGLSLLRVFSHS